MRRVELGALVLASTLLVAGWAQIILKRQSLPRMRALLQRKPHRTRRAYLIRFAVWNFETLRMVVPGCTACLFAMLGAAYLVDVQGWPDLAGVAFFLGTGVSLFVAYLVVRVRIARRTGMSCPNCGRIMDGIMNGSGMRFMKSGCCPSCSTTVFR